MDKGFIIKELDIIFSDVLDLEDLQLSVAHKAADIDEWDSLNHIQLVVAIEKRFKIKFNTTEIRAWSDVGSICESIIAKITNE